MWKSHLVLVHPISCIVSSRELGVSSHPYLMVMTIFHGLTSAESNVQQSPDKTTHYHTQAETEEQLSGNVGSHLRPLFSFLFYLFLYFQTNPFRQNSGTQSPGTLSTGTISPPYTKLESHASNHTLHTWRQFAGLWHVLEWTHAQQQHNSFQ